MFRRVILVLGLMWGSANAMTWAFEVGRELIQDAPKIAGAIGAGAAIIYEATRPNSRTDNPMPIMGGMPKYDSNPIEEFLSDAMSKTLTETRK
jgi:hypothetical protein